MFTKIMMKIIYVFSTLLFINSCFTYSNNHSGKDINIEFDDVINATYENLKDSAYMYVNMNDSIALSYLLRAFDEEDPQNPYHLYDASALAARLGQTDLSFDLLQMAIEKGYSIYNHIKNNKDFPTLDSERFNTLLKKVKSRDSLLNLLTIKLDSIFVLDQNIRNNFHDKIILKQIDIESHESKQILDSMKIIDCKNLEFIDSIVDKYGFLGRCLKTDQSKNTIYAIYLHAPFEIIEKKLDVIKNAVKSGELSCQQFPYFADRITIHRTGKQKYGTQFIIKGKKTILVSLLDSLNVNEYRSKFRLSPIDIYNPIIDK